MAIFGAAVEVKSRYSLNGSLEFVFKSTFESQLVFEVGARYSFLIFMKLDNSRWTLLQ